MSEEQVEMMTESDIRLLNTKVTVFDRSDVELVEGIDYLRDGYKITPLQGVEIYKERYEQI